MVSIMVLFILAWFKWQFRVTLTKTIEKCWTVLQQLAKECVRRNSGGTKAKWAPEVQKNPEEPLVPNLP